jgi:hypothetical protein
MQITLRSAYQGKALIGLPRAAYAIRAWAKAVCAKDCANSFKPLDTLLVIRQHYIMKDIDIVILEMKQKNGLTIVKAKKYLSEELHMNVDLGLFDSLRLFVKKRVEKELFYV